MMGLFMLKISLRSNSSNRANTASSLQHLVDGAGSEGSLSPPEQVAAVGTRETLRGAGQQAEVNEFEIGYERIIPWI